MAKYTEWLEDDSVLKLQAWARDGLTNEQIATNMGINACTLYEWKEKFPKIAKSLKAGKEVVDIIVENALYESATTGSTFVVEEAIKLKKVYWESGHRCEEEIVKIVELTKRTPPSNTAQIYWLKNRKPDQWSDKHVIGMDSIGKLDELLSGIKNGIEDEI